MQVAQQHEHVTHAVIGGKQAIEFGISSSAEFFNILSSTLYSDQILAVVREVLCNAWDAHIEAGYKDVPVQVTLTNDKFVIKDFGKGIHHDDMGPIYATYGNSTKKNDGNQTGGFGLGCKAPFAYTEHFEVTSCHAGVKTIYTISKSSAQAQGKPGITPIASFPTSETGLQVSIGIKSNNDFMRFSQLIKLIARNGDMNIHLNGAKLPGLEFDATARSFTIRQRNVMGSSATNILIRYGNVVYPVQETTGISGECAQVIGFLNKLGGQGMYCIIFQAPPHSIAVTPSRESLSMQDHTIKTLRKLFNDFMEMVETDFEKVCQGVVKEATAQAVAEKKISILVNRRREFLKGTSSAQPMRLDSLKEMATQYMGRTYPNSLNFHKEDIKHRLSLMEQAKMVERGVAQSFLRELDKSKVALSDRRATLENNAWLKRKVIAPLLSKLQASGLDHSRLYVCDPMDANRLHVSSYGVPSVPLVQANRARPIHHIATLPYLRNIVVLATAKLTMIERAFKHPVFTEMGCEYGFLFYHVGMKAADRDAAQQFFNASGMKVVDLTSRQAWEKEPEKASIPRKPAKKGVVKLSHLAWSPTRIRIDKFKDDDAPRTETPEFIAQVSFRSGVSDYELEGFNATVSAMIVSMFGDKGGVVNSSSSKDAWQAKGAKTLRAYVEEKVCAYMLSSPTIREYWAFHPQRVVGLLDSHGLDSLVLTIYRSEALRNHFSIKNNLSAEDRQYLLLWETLTNPRHIYTRTPVLSKAIEEMHDIALDPINQQLMDKFMDSPLMKILDISGLVRLLDHSSTDKKLTDKALSVLHTIISP